MGSDTVVKLLAVPIVAVLFIMAFLPFYGSLSMSYHDESYNDSRLQDLRDQSMQVVGFAENLKDNVTVISTATEDDSGGFRIFDLFSNLVGSAIQGGRMVFNSVTLFGGLIASLVPGLQLSGGFTGALIGSLSALVLLLVLGVFLKWLFKI